MTHCTPDDDPAKNKPGSIGPPLPNTEVKVADWGTGESYGPNQDGEIWVRGRQVMKGYLNNPEATAHTIDDQGWTNFTHGSQARTIYVSSSRGKDSNSGLVSTRPVKTLARARSLLRGGSDAQQQEPKSNPSQSHDEPPMWAT